MSVENKTGDFGEVSSVHSSLESEDGSDTDDGKETRLLSLVQFLLIFIYPRAFFDYKYENHFNTSII